MKKILGTITLTAFALAAVPAAVPAAKALMSVKAPGETGAPVIDLARRGRAKDDPAGHQRRGRGADDPVGHA